MAELWDTSRCPYVWLTIPHDGLWTLWPKLSSWPKCSLELLKLEGTQWTWNQNILSIEVTNIDATLFSFIHKWCCESMYRSVMSHVTFGYAISSPCPIDHTKGLAQQITKFCSALLCNISFAFSPKIDFYKEGNVWTQEKVKKNPGTNHVDLQKLP